MATWWLLLAWIVASLTSKMVTATSTMDSCDDDPDVDLCAPNVGDTCADDPDVDLCSDDVATTTTTTRATSIDSCADDPEMDLCAPNVGDTCADDPDVDLCSDDAPIRGVSCDDDPELDLCTDDEDTTPMPTTTSAVRTTAKTNTTTTTALSSTETQSVVAVFVIESISYSKVNGNETLKASLERGITQAVRQQLGDQDTSIISVTLSSGSVIARATITPKQGSSMDEVLVVLGKVEAGQAAMQSMALDSVMNIVGKNPELLEKGTSIVDVTLTVASIDVSSSASTTTTTFAKADDSASSTENSDGLDMVIVAVLGGSMVAIAMVAGVALVIRRVRCAKAANAVGTSPAIDSSVVQAAQSASAASAGNLEASPPETMVQIAPAMSNMTPAQTIDGPEVEEAVIELNFPRRNSPGMEIFQTKLSRDGV